MLNLLHEMRRAATFDGASQAVREARVAELLRSVAREAFTGSRFYRERGVAALSALASSKTPAEAFLALSGMPPLTKADLSDHFDAIVTDPEISLSKVAEFDAAHPDGKGMLQTRRGTYNVKKTSGTSGTLVYQVDTLATQKHVTSLLVQRALFRTLAHRGGFLRLVPVPTRAKVVVFVHRGNRSVYQGATTQAAPWFARALLRVHVIAHDASFEAIRGTLGELAPEYIFALPSRLEWLAKAQLKGHLAIAPEVVFVGGETLHESLLELCRKAWPSCSVVNTYGTTETKPIATACPECRELHVLEDIVHLELLDAAGAPCPPGTEATRVLATSLKNLTVPVFRYVLTDRITPLPDAGCRWRTRRIRVSGREPAFLWVQSRRDGSWHPLNGRMLKESLTALPGAPGFAVRHDAPGRLAVTLVVETPSAASAAERAAREAVGSFAKEHGCDVGDVLPELTFRVVDKDTWSREGGKLHWIATSVEPPELSA